jgi:hypothetical protein
MFFSLMFESRRDSRQSFLITAAAREMAALERPVLEWQVQRERVVKPGPPERS